MSKAFVLTKICRTTLRKEGAVFMTGVNFSAYELMVKVGNQQRKVTVVLDGLFNNNGCWVDEPLEEVIDIIMKGSKSCGSIG